MASIIRPSQQLLGDFYEYYYRLIRERMSAVPTLTYGLTCLAICLPPILLLILYEREKGHMIAEQPRGCRKLGMKKKSNLWNEFDKKFSGASRHNKAEPSTPRCNLKSMWIYPVKSCRGVELDEGTVVATGMEYDRQFTFAQLRSPFPVAVDTPNSEKAAHKWEFITQRQFPLLAKVRTEIWVPDHSLKTWAPNEEAVKSGGVIILYFPFERAGWRGSVAKWGAALMGKIPEKEFRIPYDPTPMQIKKAGYPNERMTIWKETVNALNLENEVPEELRYYLGISNKLGLFRTDNSKPREVYRNAPRKEELGYQPITGFQDAYPLHLMSLSSIRDVEAKMPKVKGLPLLSATRFRANLIITGLEAYHEDNWKRIRIGRYEYDVSCRTARCKMPNVNQITGERHVNEPDRTLRKERAIDEGAGKNTGCLGVQMVPCAEESLLRVGDEITVLETGSHRYIPQ